MMLPPAQITPLPTPENRQTSKRLNELRLTTVEWGQDGEVISIPQPFEELPLVFSSTTRGLAACVAPWVVGPLEELKRDDGPTSQLMSSFRDCLIEEVETRIQITDDYLMASALHPTFNTLWFWLDKDQVDRVKSKLPQKYNSLAPQEAMPIARSDHEQEDERIEGSSGFRKLLKRRRLECESTTINERPTEEEFERYFKVDLKDDMIDLLEWWGSIAHRSRLCRDSPESTL